MAPPKLRGQFARKLQKGGNLIDYVTIREASGTKIVSIVIMAAMMIIILAVVLYIIYLIKTSTFSKTQIIKGTIQVSDQSNQIKPVSLGSSSTSTSTYVFWVYLTSFVPEGVQNEPGLVWMGFTSNGSSTMKDVTATTSVRPKSNSNSASPIVSIDSSTNRMYASFFLNAAVSSTTTANNSKIKLSSLKPSSTNYTGDIRHEESSLSYVTIPIDYVPLQRWIQYTFIVSSSAVTIYQDASIYSVRSASDLSPWTQNSTITRPLFNTGNPPNMVMTYANTDESKGPLITNAKQQQNLYLANMTYYNYGLSQNDIQSLYNKGPQTTGSWFSWLNLPGYKLQWPVAKVSSSASSSTTQTVNNSKNQI